MVFKPYFGKTAQSITVKFTRVSLVAKGPWFGLIAVFMKEGGKMECVMVKELCSGLTVESILADGKRTIRMVKGQMEWPSGKLYRGHFEEGKRSGKGKIKYEDGTIWKGEFLEGKPVKD